VARMGHFAVDLLCSLDVNTGGPRRVDHLGDHIADGDLVAAL
jgi:hypothetical protein